MKRQMITKSQKLCSLKSKKDGIIYDMVKLMTKQVKDFYRNTTS